ncbi:MAG: glycoside hydrolase family 31 protein [Polyangiaceae bacterium]|nr:glycoside hydrolase family 31 protein [Polyangiaceae bacterium]
MLRRTLLLLALPWLIACGAEDPPREPPVAERCPSGCFGYTPRWAFEPWISKDISSGADTRTFVGGFRERDIPVGVVVLDSPWETNYNTFVPNPTRYPAFDELVGELGDQGVRVVCWMTGLVNWTSVDFEAGGDTYAGPAPNFEEGDARGFFVNDAELYNWWKGRGAGVDYFSPEARAWWHAQQRALLEESGLSGWKLDFGDQYIASDPVQTSAGPKSHQEYSEQYYRAEYENGVAVRGAEEFVTMVRPYDRSYGFPGRTYARKEHAPVGWVGDNRRDWIGLADALDHVFRSAELGYVVLGSDIGGYLDRDDENLLEPEIPFDQTNFARWTALGALMPFMQLHGRANLEPWSLAERPEETVELYRYWATLHHELVPFFYSLAEEAYAGGPTIVRPIGDATAWAGDYRFQVGDALLVAPLIDATGRRDVALPADASWYDWWDLGADALPGGGTLARDYADDRLRLPLFVRAGAIVPVEAGASVTGLGASAAADALTVLVWPGAATSRFRVHERDRSVTEIEATAGGAGAPARVCVRGTLTRATWLRVRSDSAPTEVLVDARALPNRSTVAALEAEAEGWRDDRASRTTWVRLAPSRRSACVTLG